MSENLPIGNLADILAIDDVQEKVVNVPEWNCSVKIRALTKGKQIALRKQSTVRGVLDENRLEGLLFVYGVVEPAFSPEHVERLFSKSAGAVDRVLMEVMELSGMTDPTGKDAEADFRE